MEWDSQGSKGCVVMIAYYLLIMVFGIPTLGLVAYALAYVYYTIWCDWTGTREYITDRDFEHWRKPRSIT